MERKEETNAAKILVDFVRDFTLLTEQQLVSVRKMMEETVRSVMENVMNLSKKASSNKEKADQVLVRDEKNQEIVVSHQKHVAAKAAAMQGEEVSKEAEKDALESQLIRTGGLLAKHMEALSLMDGELKGQVLGMVGSVSIDDLMAQRLNHVINSLHHLQRELSEVLSQFKKYNSSESMKAFRNRVLTEIYLSYTSEGEREIFHKIFGHPKEVKKAS